MNEHAAMSSRRFGCACWAVIYWFWTGCATAVMWRDAGEPFGFITAITLLFFAGSAALACRETTDFVRLK